MKRIKGVEEEWVCECRGGLGKIYIPDEDETRHHIMNEDYVGGKVEKNAKHA